MSLHYFSRFFSRIETLRGRNNFTNFHSSRLQDKIAIITGAAAGVGRATAELFLLQGIQGLVLVDRNVDKGLKAEAKMKRKSFFIECDVSQEDQVQNMVERTLEKFGKIDVLVNNVGVMHPQDIDEQMDVKIWQEVLSYNILGQFLVCKHVINSMLKTGGGSIINTSSFLTKVGSSTGLLAYAASKGGVSAMTRELAIVHAKSNIRVNAICPGAVNTNQHNLIVNTEEKIQQRLQHLPMRRFGEDVEVADVISFLASSESSYITGTEVFVEGGLTSCYVP